MKINTLSGGLFGTNTYILTEGNDAIVIDYIPEVWDYIKKNNLNLKKILLTHIHYDHFQGLSDLQNEIDFKIYMSQLGFDRINDGNYTLINSILEHNIFPDIKLDSAIIVNNNDIISFNSNNIRVSYTPGHSEESLSYILDNQKSVFVGDLIFYGSIGRTDLIGGDFDTLNKSVKNLFNIIKSDYTIYPGHGSSTNVKFEKENNPFLNF